MNSKKHPLVGLFVSGYLFGQNCVARVDAVKMSGRGKNKVMTGLVVRPANTHMVSSVPSGLNTWQRAEYIYTGNRRNVELKLVKSVWPGAEEAWVPLQDFLDWCEGPEP